jgi:hypothetical protein
MGDGSPHGGSSLRDYIVMQSPSLSAAAGTNPSNLNLFSRAVDTC